MQHMTFKAAVATTTDAGIFEAVISTEAIDRENDVVVPEAMVDALKAWTFTGKMLPLAWNHSSDPEDIIGHVNPTTVKAVAGEVHATGWIDQDTDRGRHVWRLAKSGTLGFSFGYLIPDGGAVKRADGVREIRKLDVFEITATPAPMNAATRVLSTKGVEDDEDRIPTQGELERMLIDAGIIPEPEPVTAAQYQQADTIFTGTGPNGDAETKADDRVRAEWRDHMRQLLRRPADQEPDQKALPAKKTEPIQVATFEC